MLSLELLLRPLLACEKAEQCMFVRMTLEFPAVARDTVIFHHVLARGPIKTMQYKAVDIDLQDSQGPVSVYSRDSSDRRQRKFFAERDIAPGRLVIEYQATPSNVTESSPCGPQIALERDGGGLTAGGMFFILRPAIEGPMSITVEWDLSSTPSGTRAACSLGEGPKVSIQANPAVLDECFFAVGSLHSYPTEKSKGDFGMYWLENPPFDASALGRQMESLLPKMTEFFNDRDSTYRIFIRRNIQKCGSGRGLYRGFVFAWTTIVPRDEDELQEFLMHETVHNWPRLGFSSGGPTAEELADGWFNEGIADYYSIFLPYRFGIFSEKEFIRRINIRVSGYYTNPDRDVKNKDVQDRFWNGGHVNRIPYQRGFMYFMKLAYQLKKAEARSLDELILEMVKFRHNGTLHSIAVWLDMLKVELGPIVMTDYRSMSDAVPIILPPDCLQILENLDWTLQREDQEELFLGFPEDCLDDKPAVVKDLDLESRAAQAGVRNGDIIMPQHSLFVIAERWGRKFEMPVKRVHDGSEELKVISWSPRSWVKVESYQFTHL